MNEDKVRQGMEKCDHFPSLSLQSSLMAILISTAKIWFLLFTHLSLRCVNLWNRNRKENGDDWTTLYELEQVHAGRFKVAADKEVRDLC